MKIHTNDQVIVISGKDKGKKGKVTRAFPSENKVLVEGINLVTKHVKGNSQTPGYKTTFEKPVDVSNVMLLDPKSGEPTRIGYKIQDGNKVGRIAKKSGTSL